MWRKMLAVVVTATLMAGTAWGVDYLDATSWGAAKGDASTGLGGGASKAGAIAADDVSLSGGNDISVGATAGTVQSIVGDLTLESSATGYGILFGGTGSTVAAITNGVNFTLRIGGDLSATSSGTNMGVGFFGRLANGNALASGLTNLTVGGSIIAVTNGTGETVMNGLTITANDTLGRTGESTYSDALDIANGTIYHDKGDVAIFADSITGGATAGTSTWNGASTVTIDGMLTIGGDGSDLVITGADTTASVGALAFADEHIVSVDAGAKLMVTDTTGTTVFAADQDLTIGATSAAEADFKGGLQFVGDAELDGAGAGGISTLKADSLKIGDEAATATEITASGLDVTIAKLTTIYDGAEYTVDGSDDEYNEGIKVIGAGELKGNTAANASTAIDVKTAGVTLENGGTISADTAGTGTFAINGSGGVKVRNDVSVGTDDAAIDAWPGGTGDGAKIDIEGDLNVAGDLELVTAAHAQSMITAGTYTQTAGVVEQSNAGQFTVEGAASITGAGSDFQLLATGGANDVATFIDGLKIGAGASLTAIDGAERVFALGANKVLTLEGGTLNTGAGGLNVDDANASTIRVTGNGSMIAGAGDFTAANSLLEVNATYEQMPSLMVNSDAGFDDVQVKKGELALGNITLATDKNVTVDNGAYIAHLGGGAATIAASGAAAAQAFTAKAGSNIEAHNGSFALTGFDTADLDGNVLIGATGGNVNTIASDADATTVGATANIVYNVDAVNAIKGMNLETNPLLSFRNTSGDVDALAISDAAKVQLTSVGQFTYEKNADGGIYLIEANNLVNGDDTEKNRGTYLGNLRTAWAPKGAGAEIDSTLASASFYANQSDTNKIVVRNNPATPEYDGRLSLNLLAAMHSKTDGYTQGVGKAIFRNGNVSEMLNAGIGEIGGITSAIGARNTQLRGQMAGAGDVYYEYANPSLILNNEYANRVWAGYIGQWEKGDARNGVAGYDYDSNGFIVGYDRLVGCNFAFGGAFAYSRGDYEDKAAISNSSKIDNYSFNGYATYSALNGVFASLFGGYTRQKSDINATYRALNVSNFKKSDYDTDYWNIGGQLGYDFQPVDGLVLTPSIGLQYIHGKADSHFSSYWNAVNGEAGGYVGNATQKALLLPIELAAKYNINFSDCSRLTVEGNVGYSYNFLNDNGAASMTLANVQTANGEAVIIDGYDRDAGRHTFNAGAGLRYTFNRFDVGVKYDYYLQSDAHAHRLMGTVGVSF